MQTYLGFCNHSRLANCKSPHWHVSMLLFDKGSLTSVWSWVWLEWDLGNLPDLASLQTVAATDEERSLIPGPELQDTVDIVCAGDLSHISGSPCRLAACLVLLKPHPPTWNHDLPPPGSEYQFAPVWKLSIKDTGYSIGFREVIASWRSPNFAIPQHNMWFLEFKNAGCASWWFQWR